MVIQYKYDGEISTIKGHLSSLATNTSQNGYKLLQKKLWISGFIGCLDI